MGILVLVFAASTNAMAASYENANDCSKHALLTAKALETVQGLSVEQRFYDVSESTSEAIRNNTKKVAYEAYSDYGDAYVVYTHLITIYEFLPEGSNKIYCDTSAVESREE